MEFDKYSLGIKYNFSQIGIFTFVVLLPNLLGMLNFTMMGFKLHFFQLGIVIAAMLYGPIGGISAGLIGSIFSSVMMHNPYIIAGNMILGFFIGLFFRNGLNVIIATLFAYFIQLPFLFVTDYYLIGMPLPAIVAIIISLFISNTMWATIVHLIKGN